MRKKRLKLNYIIINSYKPRGKVSLYHTKKKKEEPNLTQSLLAILSRGYGIKIFNHQNKSSLFYRKLNPQKKKKKINQSIAK